MVFSISFGPSFPARMHRYTKDGRGWDEDAKDEIRTGWDATAK